MGSFHKETLNTYDRHLLREWLQILSIVIGAMMGLLLMQVLYDDFRELKDIGARASDFLIYFLVTIPGFLGLVLPVALLISLLFVLGKLHRANELIVLRAAGVGLLRITAPVWLIGVFACGATWYLNASIVPWSVETSRELRTSLNYRHAAKTLAEEQVGVIQSVAFDNRETNRMWYFNRYSNFTQKGYGVTVSELNTDRKETQRLIANQAWYYAKRGGWVFRDGQILTMDPLTGEMLGPKAFEEEFRGSFSEDPEIILLIDRKAINLSLHELKKLMDFYAIDENPKGLSYAVRYFGILADAFGPLLVIALAVPFAVSGVRVNPAVGVSKSIGLFFLYYILMNVANALAAKNLMDPLWAAWLPNIGMSTIAVWLFWRLR